MDGVRAVCLPEFSVTKPAIPVLKAEPRIRQPQCRRRTGVYSRRLVKSPLRRPEHVCRSQDTGTSSSPADQKISSTKAVIFDMDGVLCNSEATCRRAAAEMFSDLYEVNVPESAFIPFQGRGEKVYFESVAAQFGVTSFDLVDARDRFTEIYVAALNETDVSFPGSRELVRACAESGFQVAVASSADNTKLMASLAAIEMDPSMFGAVISGNIGFKPKPSPEIFLEAAKLVGVSPNNCLVLEDSIAGVQAAKKAGMACLGLTTTETKEVLIRNGADAVFKVISEISLADVQSSFFEPQQKSEGVTAAGPIQDWLRETVNLPGSLKTDRRSVLQVMNLGLAFTCGYLIYSRSQALSFMSPKGFVATLSPFKRHRTPIGGDGSRVDAFKRYIADVERKGGGLDAGDFPQGLDWLNAPPLSLKRELDGRLVILDFWTYCCINCMHVLPDLAYIERQFSDQPVTVVGVHSAKFDNEKDSNAIRNAVLRYDVNHPVVNDRNMIMWRNLGVSSWPTLIVLSPKGQVLFTLPGEGHRQDLDDLLTAGLEYYKERDLLKDKAVPMAPEKLKDTRLLGSNLRYPAKLATDLQGNRLFVSDSNNHRIVIMTLTGSFVDQIGGNGAKLLDGSFEVCCFKRPQGVCYDASRDVLYVADTENHALREVRLRDRTVTTLAGNGYQGRDYKGGGKGKAQQLSSPWDVEMAKPGDALFVAMAGQHQIWKYDLKAQTAEVFSGNGYESNKNGDNARNTSWAQPSGISLLVGEKNEMVVADSESSSVRKLNLETGGSSPLAGGDPLFAENLFRFGDKDGKFSQVLLQHPLGILAVDDQVYVADSYNHKMKLCDLRTAAVSTVAGSGRAGYSDGRGSKSELSEPSGLAPGPGKTVLVADTNNNLIRRFHPQTGVLETLELTGVPPPRVSRQESEEEYDGAVPAKVVVGNDMAAREGAIRFKVKFPRGFGFTKGATSSFYVHTTGRDKDKIKINPERGIIATKLSPNIQIQYSSEASQLQDTRLQVDCKIYYCEEGKECLLEDIRYEIPLSESLTQGRSDADVILSVVGYS